jgi:hypothetical protein
MTSKEKTIERRKHKRFQAPKGLFAMLKPGHTKVGSVVDVSTRGLAFRYVDREEIPNGTDIDIFMIGNDFRLGKVPVKTILDVEVVQGTHYYPITIRRCAVQFGELTPVQKSELESFIQNHTLGEVV